MSIYEYDEERHMRQTREEGVEEGYTTGLATGLKQGVKQEKEQIALKLLNAGVLTEEQISAVTGLSQTQLEELMNINKDIEK